MTDFIPDRQKVSDNGTIISSDSLLWDVRVLTTGNAVLLD